MPFKSLNFKQLINSLTRISRDSKSLVDFFAVNYPQNICDSGVVSANLSDHEPVYCVRKINWRKAPAQFKTFRNYANYNPCDFRLIISFVSNGSYCRSSCFRYCRSRFRSKRVILSLTLEERGIHIWLVCCRSRFRYCRSRFRSKRVTLSLTLKERGIHACLVCFVVADAIFRSYTDRKLRLRSVQTVRIDKPL